MRISDFWADPARVELLRQRWAEGATCRAIADELGCSKNAVIGKARRIKLDMRVEPPAKLPRPDPFDGLDTHDCRWPIGHPGDPDFRFCRGPALVGKPYCAEHCYGPGGAYINPKLHQALSDRWTEERRQRQRARILRRQGSG